MKKKPTTRKRRVTIIKKKSTPSGVDPKLIDVVHSPSQFPGYDERMARKYDTLEALRDVQGTVDMPGHLWIEPRDWRDVAERNKEFQTRPKDFWSHFTQQNPTHECVAHAGTQVWSMFLNRQNTTSKYDIWFSPLYLYSQANPSIRGGTYISKVLSIMMEGGILPEDHGPKGLDTQKKIFQHTLHQTAGSDPTRGGDWVAERDFPVGHRNTARHFKPLEFVNLASWQEIICMLLHGYAVWVGRNQHSIPYYDVIWNGPDLYNDLLVPYSDSYDIERMDSLRMVKRAVGGAVSIMAGTRPHDPARPAGDDMLAPL